MNTNQSIILTNYLNELAIKGENRDNPKYSIKIFFNYINESGIEFQYLKVNQAQDFQTYLITKTNSKGKINYCKATVINIIGCLSSFYIYLKRKKIVIANPFLQIKKVKKNKGLPRNIFTEEKMDNFLNRLKTFWKAKSFLEKKQLYRAHIISELMYSTGMRINEVIKLKVEDIDFYRGIIKIKDNKTKQERYGVLSEYVCRILQIYIDRIRKYLIYGSCDQDTDLLFGVKNNLRTWLNRILTKESSKLKYGKFTSHNFRHALGCHLLKAGCDLRFIQEILGHKELNTTVIYTKVEKEDLKCVLDKYHPRRFKS